MNQPCAPISTLCRGLHPLCYEKSGAYELAWEHNHVYIVGIALYHSVVSVVYSF